MTTAYLQPLVSIIVPVYNSEQYLEQCLQSLLEQSYNEIEIICIDDGSTDGSVAILQKFATRDARVTVLTQQNKGPGAARNAGLSVARGEWITGVDADDYLDPGAIDYALNLTNDEVDIVCFSSTVETALETRAEENDYVVNSSGIALTQPAAILEQTNVYFWNKLWRKTFIEKYKLRFTEGLWYEDSGFAYCAFPFARMVVYGTRRVHHYRMHEQSIMSQTFNKNARSIEHLDQLAHVLAFYQKHAVAKRFHGAACVVFRKLFGSCMAHIPQNLQKRALQKAAAIVDKYELRRLYPCEGSINAARWIPWYLRPFFRVTYSKREYRVFWIPILSVKFQETKTIYRVFGIPVFTTRRSKIS